MSIVLGKAMISMERIDFKNTKDEVAEIIKREIISGNITSSDSITQNYIADKFGLSRMPIREAFNTLVQEGLLIKHNNRKLEVANITSNTIRNYNGILSSIETNLLMELFRNKKNLLSLESVLNEKIIPYDVLVKFHYLLSELIDDNYIFNMHRNILSVFWYHGVRYCSPDYKNAIIKMKKALDECGQNSPDRGIIYDYVFKSNNVVLESIPVN